MPVIVPPGQFNPAALSADDLYISILNPPGFIRGVPSDVFGIVGTGSWGPLNTPVHMGSPFDALVGFGPVGAPALNDPYDLATDLAIAFGQATSQASLEGWAVRVSDGTDVKATAAVAGAATSASAIATLTGTISNGDTTTLIFTSSAIAGSPVNIVAPSVTADTLTTLAAKFVVLINANAALNAAGIFANNVAGVINIYQPTTLSPQMVLTKINGVTEIVTITAGAAVTAGVTLQALYSGVLGNQIVYTITAGSVPASFNVQISLPAIGISEMYPNLAGAQFPQNLANAVNLGMSNVRGPSALVTGVNPNRAVGAPALVGNTLLTGGTDGRVGVTTATLLGSDSAFPKTGLYALRQLRPAVGVCWIVGSVDQTLPASLVTFGQSEGATMLFPFPTGTSTTTAATQVGTIGIHDPAFMYVKDWVYWFDVLNNVLRLVSPLAFIGGTTASLSPVVNPGNKTVNLVIGTERYNPISGNIPYTISEVGILANNGIAFISNPIPAGTQWGIRTAQTTSINAATAGVEWWRTTMFLARSFAASMGQFVDQNQSQKPNDPLRNAVRNQLSQFLQFLVSPAAGIGDGNGLIDDYTVICGFSASPSAQAGNGINTPSSIAQHFLFVLVKCLYLSNVRFFVIALQGGTTVVTVGATQGQSLQ